MITTLKQFINESKLINEGGNTYGKYIAIKDATYTTKNTPAVYFTKQESKLITFNKGDVVFVSRTEGSLGDAYTINNVTTGEQYRTWDDSSFYSALERDKTYTDWAGYYSGPSKLSGDNLSNYSQGYKAPKKYEPDGKALEKYEEEKSKISEYGIFDAYFYGKKVKCYLNSATLDDTAISVYLVDINKFNNVDLSIFTKDEKRNDTGAMWEYISEHCDMLQLWYNFHDENDNMIDNYSLDKNSVESLKNAVIKMYPEEQGFKDFDFKKFVK